jgi:AcrR family transcriptional regulator
MSENPKPRSGLDAERRGIRDGEDARHRLVHAGLRLFAGKGYTNTTTRELADAAGVNVAAISYYFGDKAGLYRAAFFEPMGAPEPEIARFDDPSLGLEEMLRAFYALFLEPLRDPATAALNTRLHFREMLEPTGLWQEVLGRLFEPLDAALVRQLCRLLALAEADEALHRLAASLTGLGVHLHVGRDCIEALHPGLYNGDAAIDRWADTLVRSAVAMIDAERRRRGAPEGRP